MLAFFIDGERRGGEVGCCERADGYANAAFPDLVVNRSAADWAEVERDLAALIADANVSLRFTFDLHRFAAKARLRSEHAAGSTLAREAVANPYPNRVFADGCGELPAAARGCSCGHLSRPES